MARIAMPVTGPNPSRDTIDVSIVVPLRDEEPNVESLHRELMALLARDARRYEVIFVDDGSVDGTVRRLRELAGDHPRVTIIELARCFGQTAALAAGFRAARGQVIVPMDGDGQNDPADVPALVAKLDEHPGFDVVSGWRRDRQDRLLTRTLPSWIANALLRWLTSTPNIHDFGCSLKAYRREVLDDVRLYGEMHRYLPVICKWRGARVTEMVVKHRPRQAGRSKYGLKRTAKVLLDVITVKFLGDYLTKPLYFFGKIAGVFFGGAALCVVVAILQRVGYLTGHGHPVKLNNNVLVLFAMMTGLMSIMFITMGVISELLVRIYHESQGRSPYRVRRITRGGTPGAGSLEDVAEPAELGGP